MLLDQSTTAQHTMSNWMFYKLLGLAEIALLLTLFY
jgi:hypothetical protein